MRRLVVLGAGTAGTMVVNKLRKRLSREEWDVVLVDQDAHRFPRLQRDPIGVLVGGDQRRH